MSIDDHMIEPPDLFENHVPDKGKDSVPRVVRNEAGVDGWHFQGERTSGTRPPESASPERGDHRP